MDQQPVYISQLEKYRLAQRWTLREMAEQARKLGFKLGPATIGKVEKGTSTESINTLTAYAIAETLRSGPTPIDLQTEDVIRLYQETRAHFKKTA